MTGDLEYANHLCIKELQKKRGDVVSIYLTVNTNQETSRKVCSKQSVSLLVAKQQFARSKVGACLVT